MKKNILAENLIRFGVKNLKEFQKRYILESVKYADKVTFNGKTYYVHATADDFDNRGISVAQNKYTGNSTFNPNNFVVLSMNEVPGYDYSMAYQELQQGNYIVVNDNEVDNGSSNLPKQDDVVTYNGEKYVVLASAGHEASLEPNDSWMSQKIKEAGADKNNWVLLLAGERDPAYDDLSNEQLKFRFDAGIFKFVKADDLNSSTSSSSSVTTTLEPGSWEAFSAAIANKINKDKNDPGTNLTSGEIDKAYEKLNQADRNRVWIGIWGEYKNAVNNNDETAMEQAVDWAIRDYFSKVK